MLNILPIAAFSDNYIWLMHHEGSRQAVVVDPGDAAPVIAALEKMGLDLVCVLITHHHFDHVGGLEALCEKYSPVVYGPKNPDIQRLNHRLEEGDTLDVLGLKFEVLEVPGHTLDHIAFFHSGDAPIVFCGDTLFAGGCGRVFEGNPEMMLASLDALAQLPQKTQVFCAHEYTLSNLEFALAAEPKNAALIERMGEAKKTRERNQPTVPSTLSLELATNPFMRCHGTQLRESLAESGKLEGTSPVDVFATVRSWKDTF